jgi:putative membrane protein
MMPSERRLHPLSILFAVTSTLRAFLIPLLLLLFAARSSYELWVGVMLFPTLVAALVRYAAYRYTLTGEELVIRSGLIFKNERHIPYSRIHNLAAVQTPLHRLLGVVEVRVETGGGAEPEARMKVLSLAARDELRRCVLDQRTGKESTEEGTPHTVPAPPERRSILRLPVQELLLQGFIDNRGMLVVGGAVGLLYQFDFFSGAQSKLLRGAFGTLGDLDGALNRALVVAAMILGFLVLLRIFSIARAVIQLYGFDVRSNGSDLRTTYGLLTRNTSTIPLHRIQLLSVGDGPLQRLFERVEVHADTAGGKPTDGDSPRHPMLAPLLRRSLLGRFVGDVQPGIDLDRVAWNPVHASARGRLFRSWTRMGLLVTALAVAGLGPWGALALPPWLVLGWINAKHQARAWQWAVLPDAVLCRRGWIRRRLTLARVAKIQCLSLAESPFDRRWGTATMRIDTAGGKTGGERLQVRFLDAAVARELLDSLSVHAAATTLRW